MIRADEQLWNELAKCFPGAVVAAANAANPPFDEHITRLRNDPRVTMYLLPLPTMAKAGSNATTSTPSTSTAAPKTGPKAQPKKKFKASKRADRSKPDALQNMDTVTKDGQNVCWSFNVESGCQAPLISGSKVPKCAKGLHVCACCHEPNHSQMVCNLKKRANN